MPVLGEIPLSLSLSLPLALSLPLFPSLCMVKGVRLGSRYLSVGLPWGHALVHAPAMRLYRRVDPERRMRNAGERESKCIWDNRRNDLWDEQKLSAKERNRELCCPIIGMSSKIVFMPTVNSPPSMCGFRFSRVSLCLCFTSLAILWFVTHGSK